MATLAIEREIRARVQWQQLYGIQLLVTDTVVVVAAVLLAQYVRFGESPLTGNYADKQLSGFSIVFVILWLSALAIFRSRASQIIGIGIEEYRRVISASFWTFGAIAITTLLIKADVVRGYLAVALPVGTVGLVAARHLWRRRIVRQRLRGRYLTAVLAIGDRDAVVDLARGMMRDAANGYQVVAVCIPGYGLSQGDCITVNGQDIPVVGDETEVLDAVARYGADTVALTGTQHLGSRGAREFMWKLAALDVDLLVSPGVMDVASTRLIVRPLADSPLIHVEKPQYQGAKRLEKRAFDFCFAVVALIGCMPILIAAALAIKLTSRGSIFYSAERIGMDGKPFKMLKFRTMIKDADLQIAHLLDRNESEGRVLFKMRNDPRITPVGAWLRRFSIDELPQFINVLKQDMSVIGPRPPLRREVETYDGEVMRRLLVRPGISGLWQVSGRSDLSWDESVRLDLSYVENWSMVGDLVLIAKTVGAVLNKDGAY